MSDLTTSPMDDDPTGISPDKMGCTRKRMALLAGRTAVRRLVTWLTYAA